MRIRALVVAATGAVALSALAVPAAQAAPAGPAVTFSNVKVNGGKNIVVGPTTKVTVPASYTVTKAAGLDAGSFATFPVLYRGTTLDESTPDDHVWLGDEPGTCTASSPTVLKCTATIQFRPKSTEFADLANVLAGTWKIGAAAINADGLTTKSNVGTIHVQRQAKLTANATPEPVKKGKTLTVTGVLTRANWDANRYAGYSGQSVKLQFRKKGSSAYTTVKTVKSSATGGLKTTVTASVDGYYRFVFAGTSTTSAVSAAGDFVDVK
ncbi:hypothetical protein ABT330_23475 [Streptomyces sp. NPDC000658]|uniref:hypothetical protein n=1 Tax=Streptomyces sp. NPDC000658 TaxID=3154266 RepID=UPI00332B7941